MGILNIFVCEDLKKEIRRTDKEANMAKKELKYWIDFKNKGTFDLKFQKELLEKEISYMKENYEIISSKLCFFYQKLDFYLYNRDNLKIEIHCTARAQNL